MKGHHLHATAALLGALLCLAPLAAQTTPRNEALQLEAQGRVTEAEQAWHTILTTTPGNPEALAHLGLLAARQDHLPEAIAFYRQALASAPQMNGLRLNLGLAYFKSTQFADALPLFTDELKSHPADSQAPRLLILLGMTHYGMGDYLVAIPFLQRATAQNPTNLPLALALAHSCLFSKQFDCVMSTYKNILTLNPNSAEAEMLAGESLDETGDDAGAIQHFQAAVAADPKLPNAHFGLGYLFWTQTHYAEAAEQFAAELANDPTHEQAHTYLGDSYLQLKRLPEAETQLNASLKLNPNAEITQRDLGILHADQGLGPQAEAELKQAILLDPTDTTAHWRLARLLQTLGKKDEAAAEFKTVSTMKRQHHDQLLSTLPQGSPTPKTNP